MAITCLKKISANIADDCTVPAVGGAENTITLVNLADYQNATITRSATNPMVIENIVLPNTKVGYTLEFAPDTINAMATRAGINTWDHSLSGKVNVSNNTVKQTLNDMDGGRFVAIVQMRNPVAETKFQVVGESSGLVITENKREANAENGIYSLTLATSDVSKEPKELLSLFKTDLTTTKAVVAALLVAVP